MHVCITYLLIALLPVANYDHCMINEVKIRD